MEWKKEATKINNLLGDNSEIKEFTDSTYMKAFNRLENKNTAGIVLVVDGEQVLSIGKTVENTRHNGYVFASDNFADAILKNSFIKNNEDKDFFSTITDNSISSGQVSYYSRHKLSLIKKIVKFIFQQASNNDKTIKTLEVEIDLKRSEKTEVRAKTREGIIPLPTGNKIAIGKGRYSTYDTLAVSFFKSLKSDLKDRLETYKASKAKSFDTKEDLLNSLIKEGYFDKLKFMGFTYEYRNDRINFRELKNPGKQMSGWSDESYIEYRIQTGTPEYNKLEADIEVIRAEFRNSERSEELQTAYYENRKKIMPPETFKVILKLDGGVITPEKIQIGKEDSYMY